MSCLEDFTEIQPVDPNKSNVFLGRKESGEEIIIKRLPIFGTGPLLEAFNQEVDISQLMSNHHIGAKIFGYRMCDENYDQIRENPTWGLILMENLDGTIKDLWPQLDPKIRQHIANMIDDKISQMHNLGIVHRDTNITNIMYKHKNGQLNVYLIDFGRSLPIFQLPTDHKYLRWLQHNPGKSMEDYVNWDFELWRLMINNI